ncbi:putative golgin subfamily A member 4-like [Apostichopus japonicus]|uniref:Putative golgin subfamily A member 4-like n=1 Tax=Stichopus japonicus TaxID=307972 RepID=A0A2G8JCP5_STIJA|nr:putative golgin subfamily A member 4-like [Apostichopus japonicus]
MFKKMKKDIAQKEASSPMRPNQRKKEGLLEQTPPLPDGNLSATTKLNLDSDQNDGATPQKLPPSTPLRGSTPENAESPLFPQYQTPAKAHPPPSDTESEVEETTKTLDAMNKNELLKTYKKQERTFNKLKTKFTELTLAYREVDKENQKVKAIMSQSQDKALRRVSELKEAAELDRQAKKHMEETFSLQLEEKDEMISVLQTQVKLLKKGEDPDGLKPKPQPESPKVEAKEDETTDEVVKNLKEKIKRLEGLLGKCKETIKGNKEKNNQLAQEKEDQTKEIALLKKQHDMEKSKFIQQLSQAKEQLDQAMEEKAISIAEAKQQMHLELEEKIRRTPTCKKMSGV